MHGNRKAHDPLAIRSARDRCAFRSLHQPPSKLAGDQAGMGALIVFCSAFFSRLIYVLPFFSPLSLILFLSPIHIPYRCRRHRRRRQQRRRRATRCAQRETTLNYLQTLKRGGKTEPTTLRCSGANVDDLAPFSVNVHSS